MKDRLIIVGIAIFAITLGVGIWKIGRTINYALSYQDQVEKTIKEMVKPECLKGGIE